MKPLKQAFVNLITSYGEDNRLFTFNICSEEGIMLDGSTIDAIEYDPFSEEMLFYYNENTGDYDDFESFNTTHLVLFYKSLDYHLRERRGKADIQEISINSQLLYVVFGKTLEEWYNKLGFDNEFWDFSLEDIADNAIEINPTMVYWFINGRFYETDEEV